MTEATNNNSKKAEEDKKHENELKTEVQTPDAQTPTEEEGIEEKKSEQTDEPVAQESKKDEPKDEPTQTHPDIKPGMMVRVHQKIKDVNKKGEEKERIQIFEGMVLARSHGSEQGATITVRKASGGVGVEKIIPLHSPMVDKIEIVKQSRVKQAKLFFLRKSKKKLKDKTLAT